MPIGLRVGVGPTVSPRKEERESAQVSLLCAEKPRPVILSQQFTEVLVSGYLHALKSYVYEVFVKIVFTLCV